MKEVHIVIENGLVQEVYADEDVSVIIYDLDSIDDEYYEKVEEEIEELKKKYEDQGRDYYDPEAEEEEE